MSGRASPRVTQRGRLVEVEWDGGPARVWTGTQPGVWHDQGEVHCRISLPAPRRGGELHIKWLRGGDGAYRWTMYGPAPRLQLLANGLRSIVAALRPTGWFLAFAALTWASLWAWHAGWVLPFPFFVMGAFCASLRVVPARRGR